MSRRQPLPIAKRTTSEGRDSYVVAVSDDEPTMVSEADPTFISRLFTNNSPIGARIAHTTSVSRTVGTYVAPGGGWYLVDDEYTGNVYAQAVEDDPGGQCVLDVAPV